MLFKESVAFGEKIKENCTVKENTCCTLGKVDAGLLRLKGNLMVRLEKKLETRVKRREKRAGRRRTNYSLRYEDQEEQQQQE